MLIRRTSLAAAAAFLVHSAAVSAQPIPIINPGFEANPIPADTFAAFIPQGWQVFDPNAIVDQAGDAVGVLHPAVGTSTFFPNGATDGLHVALIYLETDIGAGPVGLEQQLAATLQPNIQYTLSVDVGNIASGFGPPNNRFYDLDGFPGYAVQLLAGTSVIAEDHNALFGVIPEGEFRLSSVSITVPTGHPLIGQPLRIRLINLNVAETPQNPGIEVDFDNVRLTSAPIVCPADFDASGMTTVHDIFSFLNAWFAADVRADFDRQNGVNITDVFAFLNAWFAGC